MGETEPAERTHPATRLQHRRGGGRRPSPASACSCRPLLDLAAQLGAHLLGGAGPRAAVALRRAARCRHPRRGHPARQPAAGRRRHVADDHRGALQVGPRARGRREEVHRVGGRRPTRAARSTAARCSPCRPTGWPRRAASRPRRRQRLGRRRARQAAKVEAQAVAAEVEARIAADRERKGGKTPRIAHQTWDPVVGGPAARRARLLRHRRLRPLGEPAPGRPDRRAPRAVARARSAAPGRRGPRRGGSPRRPATGRGRRGSAPAR